MSLVVFMWYTEAWDDCDIPCQNTTNLSGGPSCRLSVYPSSNAKTVRSRSLRRAHSFTNMPVAISSRGANRVIGCGCARTLQHPVIGVRSLAGISEGKWCSEECEDWDYI